MDPQALLAEVRAWVRLRNGLRALLVGLGLLLAGAVVARGLRWNFPWTTAPLGLFVCVALGFTWPLRRLAWVYLWAGRRLGLGERLAALDVLNRQGIRALIEPLLEEVAARPWQPWRLLGGPIEGSAFVLALGLAVLWLANPWKPVEHPGVVVPVVVEPWESAAAGSAPSSPTTALPGSTPILPPPAGEFSYPGEAWEYSPYQDLLAAMLGLGEVGSWDETLLERVAREEGLLRRLAEMLSRMTTQGLDAAERAELWDLAQQVSRPDLRSRLMQAVEQGDAQAAQQAAEAISAVLEARERAGRPPEQGSPGEGGASPGTADQPAGPGAPDQGEAYGFVEGPISDVFLDFGDRPSSEDTERPLQFEEGGEVAGTEPGEPILPTGEGDWPTRWVGPGLPTQSLQGEGPSRAFVVPALPGEPATAAVEPGALSPQDVELLLRAREVPPELRDLVRRYFQLISGGGS